MKKIKNLLVLTKSADIAVAMANSYIDQFKCIYTDVEGEFWEKAMKGVRGEEFHNTNTGKKND